MTRYIERELKDFEIPNKSKINEFIRLCGGNTLIIITEIISDDVLSYDDKIDEINKRFESPYKTFHFIDGDNIISAFNITDGTDVKNIKELMYDCDNYENKRFNHTYFHTFKTDSDYIKSQYILIQTPGTYPRRGCTEYI